MNTPLVMNNPLIVNRLIEKYKLDYAALEINLMDYTLIGRRREIADIIRLQLYGIPWSATGAAA